ncbi:hypothetical protein [Catellatospora tritici]|uniref:hypothetical protein n=1 Tax=Catellatospora tritici TaxID=2851566 RepID=UPI001C2D5A41|nr:hypothetical protein [Catellatospora tritici]MBV1855922.1 hypothetical protein [Catellatospora tritici]
MTERIGDRATFAMEIGAYTGGLRVVDIWAGGKRLTVDDNFAFVPAFLRLIRPDAARVRLRELPPSPFPGRPGEEVFRLLAADEEQRYEYGFLRWGETVDNVSCVAYLDGELVLVFSFWRPTHPVPADRGRIFVARIDPDDFADTVQHAAYVLEVRELGERRS